MDSVVIYLIQSVLLALVGAEKTSALEQVKKTQQLLAEQGAQEQQVSPELQSSCNRI